MDWNDIKIPGMLLYDWIHRSVDMLMYGPSVRPTYCVCVLNQPSYSTVSGHIYSPEQSINSPTGGCCQYAAFPHSGRNNHHVTVSLKIGSNYCPNLAFDLTCISNN